MLSPDTHQGQVSPPLTLNRYIYAVNNPANYLDPTGHYVAVGHQIAVDVGVSGVQPEEALRKLQRDADATLVSKWHFSPDAVSYYNLDMLKRAIAGHVNGEQTSCAENRSVEAG